MGTPGNIDDLSLSEVMRVWPRTIRVFLDWHLHCIGCPIADFHRIDDSAREHGLHPDALRAAIVTAIDDGPTSSKRAARRRRSAAADADP